MSGIRKISEIDRINKLYRDHDTACDMNVISFVPPVNPNIIGLLDDVEALLSDPHTRDLTESTLRCALQHLAKQFVKAY